MMPTLITINGTFKDQSGQPATGRVTFQLSTPLTDAANNVIVAPVHKSVTLVEGALSVQLYATNDPEIAQSGATYTVTELFPGAVFSQRSQRSYQVEIPYDAVSATVDLADLAPVENSTITYGAPLSRWHLEAIIVSGGVEIADDVLPPGARVGYSTTLREVHVRAGTAPVGSGLTVEVDADGVQIATVTVADGASSGSSTGLAVDLAAGTILTFNISAIGSATPGSDIAVALIGV